MPERNPDVALWWSSEPDKSQHAYGVGSSESNRAILEADLQFKNILEALNRKGVLDSTDLFVLSDHGYSTIREVIQLEPLLKEAGFGMEISLGVSVWLQMADPLYFMRMAKTDRSVSDCQNG